MIMMMQETVQCWQGVVSPVDAVLLFHVLYYFKPHQRPALYKRLFDATMQSGSYVFVLIHPYHTCGEPSVSRLLMQMLDFSDQTITDEEVRDNMLSVGFELFHERMYRCHMNVENLDDAFLSLVLTQGERSLETVRMIARKIFGDSKQVRNDIWLGVFRKP